MMILMGANAVTMLAIRRLQSLKSFMRLEQGKHAQIRVKNKSLRLIR
jgi:hypothetical protein